MRSMSIKTIVASVLAVAAVGAALCSDPEGDSVRWNKGQALPAGAWSFTIPGYTGNLVAVRETSSAGDKYFGVGWFQNPGSGPSNADYCISGVVKATNSLGGFCGTWDDPDMTFAGKPPVNCAWKFLASLSATDPVDWKYVSPTCAGATNTGVGIATGTNCNVPNKLRTTVTNPWTAAVTQTAISYQLYEADHCKAGYENFDSVALTCTKCKVGYFRANSTVNPLNCGPCAVGTFAGAVGSTGCATCAAGTYALAAASVCTSCRAGTYGALSGASSCINCPVGKYSSTAGSTACVDCASNEIPNTNSTACVACSAGWLGKEGVCVMGPGPIAGIVIASVVVVGVIAAVIAKFVCFKGAAAGKAATSA